MEVYAAVLQYKYMDIYNIYRCEEIVKEAMKWARLNEKQTNKQTKVTNQYFGRMPFIKATDAWGCTRFFYFGTSAAITVVLLPTANHKSDRSVCLMSTVPANKVWSKHLSHRTSVKELKFLCVFYGDMLRSAETQPWREPRFLLDRFL